MAKTEGSNYQFMLYCVPVSPSTRRQTGIRGAGTLSYGCGDPTGLRAQGPRVDVNGTAAPKVQRLTDTFSIPRSIFRVFSFGLFYINKTCFFPKKSRRPNL